MEMYIISFLYLLFCDIGSLQLLRDENEVTNVWNLPDASVSIGYLFYYELPRENMDRRIRRYKAYLDRDKLLPGWLKFNETAGYFEGVPSSEDLGENYITVEAYGNNIHDFINNEFTIEVLAGNQVYDTSVKDSCQLNEEKTVVIIVLEGDFSSLSHKERVRLIKQCAETLQVSPLIIKISEQEHNDDILSDAVLAAGPGNAKRHYRNHNSSIVLHWQVGCSGNLWADSIDKLDRVKIITKNGIMSKTLGYPVIGWRLVKEDVKRPRREIVSEEVHNGIQEYSVPERAVAVDSATPVFGVELSPTMPAPTSVHVVTTSIAVLSSIHHHRHNHGYTASEDQSSVLPSSSIFDDLLSSSSDLEPSSVVSNRVVRSYASSDFDGYNDLSIEPTVPYSSDISSDMGSKTEINPSMTPVSPPPSARVTEERGMTDADDEEINNVDIVEGATPPIPEEDQENFVDSGVPSESYSPEVLAGVNQPPEIRNRIPKLKCIAGEVFKYQVLENAFFDKEDGNSRNLTLKFLSPEKGPIFDNSWIQFNERTQLLYGLPLDDQVSHWSYIISATDSSGLTVEDTIDIVVQHRKGKRTVTHAINIEVTSVPKGPQVDWELSLLDSIHKVLRDNENSSLVVLSINTTSLPYVFSITNESLPRNQQDCPQEEIETIVKELHSKLKHSVDRTIRIGSIHWVGKGHCEGRKPDSGDINYPPSKRNPVDHLNATVGQLLLYTVPEDTFYDPEDHDTRNLRLSLLTIDMKSVKRTNWLQFDEKNQEFFGIPMASNVGQTEYLLQCEDSKGKTITDSLVVTVQPAPQTLYNVEFSMKLGVDYVTFIETPQMQRQFVERLAVLFGDKNSNNIVLSGLSPGSTIVTWHNKSLPTNTCPDSQILALRQIMLGDDEKVTPAVGVALGPEFPVLNAKLTPTGLCQGSQTSVFIEPSNNSTDVTAISHGEQYLIGLVIPTIVIAIMLLCAGFVACILYRRRRTGKMTVGDEDERQSFRSKGIPVIFQDELDERPEQSNKSPVIMKEEKPPLPPPEYQRGPPLATTALLSDTEDTPYQPPPPFTTSRDSARPKPTPTYRMPPPYVPP